MNGHGECWRPRHVAHTWRPYTVGYWTYTDYGWTWVSDQDWGWATYHYGRWFFDPDHGWVWVPGPTWGPAYVTWRYGDDWIGWAPLPPAAGYAVSVEGIVPTSAYSFVQARFFLDRQLGGHFAPETRIAGLIRSTRRVTGNTVYRGRMVDRGVSVRSIEQASGRRVEQLRLRNTGSATGAPRATITNHELRVFRPPAARSRGPARVTRPARTERSARLSQERTRPPGQPRATAGRIRPQAHPVGLARQARPRPQRQPLSRAQSLRLQPPRARTQAVAQSRPRPAAKPASAVNNRPAPPHARPAGGGRPDQGHTKDQQGKR